MDEIVKNKDKFLNEDYYLSPESVKEDLQEIDDNIAASKELSRQMEAEIEKIRTAGISGSGIDRSKTYENVVRIRIGISDMISKKNSFKKSAAELFMKKRNSNIADDSTIDVAREMLKLLSASDDNKRLRESIQLGSASKTSVTLPDDKTQLKKRISREIDSGDIKLTSNERAMKHKHRGVEIVYVKASKEFHARTVDGSILNYEEYPRERIPDYDIDKEESGFMIMKDGQRIAVI